MTTLRSTCKVVVIGDSRVGKTTLIHRFVHDEYRTGFRSTVGVAFCQKKVKMNQSFIETQLWDTAGSERFGSLGSAFYHGSDCCILVFDVTCRSSFEHLDTWIRDFLASAKIKDSTELPIVVFANKSEMTGAEVTEQEIRDWAASKGVKWFYTSAKEGTNIEAGFDYIIDNFHAKISNRELNPKDKDAALRSLCC